MIKSFFINTIQSVSSSSFTINLVFWARKGALERHLRVGLFYGRMSQFEEEKGRKVYTAKRNMEIHFQRQERISTIIIIS